MSSELCDRDFAAERARLLVGCYRKTDAADPEVFARAIVVVLMQYPKSVIVAVTEPATGIPAKIKWPPTIAEIVEACNVEMGPIRRQIERDRIAEERKRALPPLPAGPPRLSIGAPAVFVLSPRSPLSVA